MLGEKHTCCLFCPGSYEPRVYKRRFGPVHTEHIKELEKVQRRAARFVKGDNNRESSVTLTMQNLKSDPRTPQGGQTSNTIL